MANVSLEERVSVLEAEFAKLKQSVECGPDSDKPWWEARFGAFKDDPLYEEAVRLGADYRKSQPTPADDLSS